MLKQFDSLNRKYLQPFREPTVYAKPHLSQVDVRRNLSATGRNFRFTCQNDK